MNGLTYIVAAAVAPHLRALAATWPGGAGMFTVPLTSDGEPPTHYLSTGPVDPEIQGQLPYSSWQQDEQGEWQETQHEGDLPSLVARINTDNPQAGLTIETVQALLPHVDVSDQQWEQALVRMGLTPVPDQTV